MGDPEHVRWLANPVLRNPTIIAAFTGWNDAGDAASNAVRHLIDGWGAQALAEVAAGELAAGCGADAGGGAAAARVSLVGGWGARVLAEIDPEEFTDFATVRPHVRLANGFGR